MPVGKNLTDEELMEAYQSGEMTAFNELYARYEGRVYAYLGKRVFNRTDLDEVFQAVFLKLHKSRHLYNGQFQFAPWLFTICRTSLLDFLKSRQPQGILNENENFDESGLSGTLSLGEAVAELSEREKTALEMRYKEGLQFSEIATRLRLSPSNVRQIVSRSLRKIRGKT